MDNTFNRSVLSVCGVIALAAGLYFFKSSFGVDLDPSKHARQYLSEPGLLVSLAQADSLRSRSDDADPQLDSTDAVITIDAQKIKGAVNRRILGLNILGMVSQWEPRNVYSDYGGGIWDAKNKRFVQGALTLMRSLAPGTLRFPGGLGIAEYDWKKTIEKDRQSFAFGIMEYLALAKELSAEPFVTLSYFTGTAQDAADLVEFLNAPAQEAFPWAMKRASLGVIKPYKVRYFELGNEVDRGDGKTVKSVSPQKYADDYFDFQKAMKNVDPDIQLGAGLYGPHWDKEIVQLLGNDMDFAISHIYPTPLWGPGLEKIPAREIFESVLAMPDLLIAHQLKEWRGLFRQFAGRDVPIVVSEFNGGFEQDKPLAYRHTLGNALLNAELIRVFMDPDQNIAAAHYWNAVNEYWGMITNGFNGKEFDLNAEYRLRPNALVFQMYRDHFGDKLIDVKVEAPAYDAGRYDFFKELLSKDTLGDIKGSNVLPDKWDIFDVDNVSSTQSDGVLVLNFGDHKQWDYYHAVKFADIEQDTYYLLSGDIYVDDWKDAAGGLALEVQDARGWQKTASSASTAKVKDSGRWGHLEVIYRTLPDAKAVKIFVRRAGDKGPFTGKAVIKNVEFKTFRPSIDPKVPYLSAHASTDALRKKIYLMVVNKDQENARKATVRFKGFSPARYGNAWVLNATSIDSTNEKGNPAMSIARHDFKVSDRDYVEYEFEPHSLTVLELVQTPD